MKQQFVYLVTKQDLNWEEFDEPLPRNPEWDAYLKRAESNARLHCDGCGRFIAGSSSRTVGSFDCVRIEYDCSKCGPMEIECV